MGHIWSDRKGGAGAKKQRNVTLGSLLGGKVKEGEAGASHTEGEARRALALSFEALRVLIGWVVGFWCVLASVTALKTGC